MDEFSTLKTRFGNDVFAKTERTEIKALEKAYADMSRRATGHTEAIKNHCITWLTSKFESLKEQMKSKNFDFNIWHEDVCEGLKTEMNKCKKGFGTIGRAQKVVNMAFKYFSCIGKEYDSLHPMCHMTLDGYTLAWYKSFSQRKVKEWSKIDSYNEYKKIQDEIKKHLIANITYEFSIGTRNSSKICLSCIPFEAEFIIWEGEITKQKYNNLIKDLEKYANNGKNKDNWIIENSFDDYLKDYIANL